MAASVEEYSETRNDLPKHSILLALSRAKDELRSFSFSRSRDYSCEIPIERPPDLIEWLAKQTTCYRKVLLVLPAENFAIAGLGDREATPTIESLDERPGSFPTPLWYDSLGRSFKPLVAVLSIRGEAVMRFFVSEFRRKQATKLLDQLISCEINESSHLCSCLRLCSSLRLARNYLNQTKTMPLQALASFYPIHVLTQENPTQLMLLEDNLGQGTIMQFSIEPDNLTRANSFDTEALSGQARCCIKATGAFGSRVFTTQRTMVLKEKRLLGNFTWCPASTELRSVNLQQPNLNSLLGTVLIEELYRLGVDTFFVAPGSRSTPLVYGLSTNPSVKHVIVHDERGAAFMALNCSRMKKSPCAVITTSGTAVANLLPAVVEASNAEIPLILLTADRPPELRDVGAPQTIDQVKLFGSFVRFFKDVPCPTDGVPVVDLLSAVDQAVSTSKRLGEAGPVHLNFMFRENLAPNRMPYDTTKVHEGLQRWSENEARSPLIIWSQPSSLGDYAHECRTIANLMLSTNRFLICAGGSLEDSDQSAIKTLARRLQCPVIPDILSGLRFGPCDYLRISYMDLLLQSEKLHDHYFGEEFVILQFGKSFLSKRISMLLGSSAAFRVIVTESRCRWDEGRHVGMYIQASPKHFIMQLMDVASHRRLDAFRELHTLSADVRKLLEEYAVQDHHSTRISEPLLSMKLSKRPVLPELIFASNSMPIRDLNMFGDDQSPLHVVANRGANGIDGIVSSALGCIIGTNQPVTLLIGDMAFFHDLSAIFTIRELRDQHGYPPLRIIVVNNQGGTIFSFLPVAAHKQLLTTYFHNSHGVVCEDLCKAMSIHYFKAQSKSELEKGLQFLYTRTESALLEVMCADHDENASTHEMLSGLVQERVDVAMQLIVQRSSIMP